MYTTILIALGFFSLGMAVGLVTFPLFMFLRARRDGSWDDSNVFNIYRVLSHLAIHPGDFSKFQYPSGKRAFPYLSKDEFSDIVDTRPEDKE